MCSNIIKKKRIYSVTMTEEELKLFSEFLEQRNFINVDINLDGKLPESISRMSQSMENLGSMSEVKEGMSNLGRGITSAGYSIEGGLGKLGAGLGLGIGVAGISGAYSRIKAAKL